MLRFKNIKFLDVLLFLFWAVVIYGSTDAVGYDTRPTRIWLFLNSGFIVSNGYRGVELAIILLSLYLFFYFKNNFLLKREYFYFFIITIFILLLITINPNNSATLLKTFFAKDSKYILLIPLFYSSVVFLKEEAYGIFIIKLFRTGFIVIVFKALTNLFFYFTNYSQVIGDINIKSTLPQADVLYFTGLVLIFLIYLYLISSDYRIIIISVFLFIAMLLSFRRTELWSTFTIIIGILLFDQIKFPRGRLILKRVFLVILIPLFLFVFAYFASIKVPSIAHRYVSIFSYFNEDLNDNEYKDSGHLEQSVEVTKSMLERPVFWGAGLQNEAYYLEGQSSSRIHSNFAYGMAQFGIFVSIYLLYLLVLFVIKWLNAIKLNRKVYNREYILFRFLVTSVLIMFIISGWASGNIIFDNYPQTYISFILVFSLLKLSPNGLNNLLLSLR